MEPNSDSGGRLLSAVVVDAVEGRRCRPMFAVSSVVFGLLRVFGMTCDCSEITRLLTGCVDLSREKADGGQCDGDFQTMV